MGFIQKKDEDKDYIDGIEVIGRGEGPNGDDELKVELHEGATAEDISGTTAAREGERELEADPELLEDLDDAADADLDSDEDEGERAARDVSTGSARTAMGRRGFYIAGAVVAVIAAAIIGFFVGSGGFGAKGVSAALVGEDQLDTPVASWSYKGATKDITVREAIESQYSLDAAKNGDGLYSVPAADTVLAYVRNQVLLLDAEARGLTVDDDELAAAALDTLGTSDFAAIAEQYRVSEDQAKEIVRDQVTIQKLYKVIVKDAPVAPQAPEEPADGDVTAAAPEYAAYIIGLLGSDWDAEAKALVEGSAYAQAFPDEAFNGETATYEQAQAAYFVAYQAFASESSGSTEDWTVYANQLFAQVDLELYGLYA